MPDMYILRWSVTWTSKCSGLILHFFISLTDVSHIYQDFLSELQNVSFSLPVYTFYFSELLMFVRIFVVRTEVARRSTCIRRWLCIVSSSEDTAQEK